MATATKHDTISTDERIPDGKPTPHETRAPRPALDHPTDFRNHRDARHPAVSERGPIRADWLDTLVWDLD